jgi:hypothetical protein
MTGKKVGPDRWIPVQLIGWSLASGGQFFVHNKTGFFLCRFFIGLCMGGFIPDAVLYLSYFYTKREMPILTPMPRTFQPFEHFGSPPEFRRNIKTFPSYTILQPPYAFTCS